VIEQHTGEDALRHMRYAEELEGDRTLIEEAIRSNQKRIRAVATLMQVDGADLLQEPQPGYNWRRIVVSKLLNQDIPPEAYR
jgi:hypothetical protein